MYRYLIIFSAMGVKTAAYTDWFDPENHWTSDSVAVIDLMKNLIMFNGETWEEIDEDHL